MKRLEQTLGIGAQLADVERIRRILGQKKLILLGHSFGAFLASLYAAEFPDHVQALVLVAPSDTLVLPTRTQDGFFDQIRRGLPKSEEKQFDAFLSEYLQFGDIFKQSERSLAERHSQMAAYFLQASGTPPREAAETRIQNGGWAVQAMYFSMGRRHDYRSALEQVRAPVLIVYGEADLLPRRVIRGYADAFPNATTREIKGSNTRAAGHFAFTDQPDAFASSVSQFLLTSSP